MAAGVNFRVYDGFRLQSQALPSFLKRNFLFLFRFLESGAGIFDIDSVHFLPGQALQEAQVIHRDDGGQVFPTAR